MDKDKILPIVYPPGVWVGCEVYRQRDADWERLRERLEPLERLVAQAMCFTSPGDDEGRCIYCGRYSHKGHEVGCEAVAALAELGFRVEWEIEEYDGREWVAEEHRTWG